MHSKHHHGFWYCQSKRSLNGDVRLAIYHLSTFPSTIRPSSSLRFVMKSACVLRGILLSLDTNLHKVQAIIGSREANYFPDKITPTPFYYLLIFNVARAEVVKST